MRSRVSSDTIASSFTRGHQMAKAKKPDLDEMTLQIAKRILSTPPKLHKDMKLGKSRAGARMEIDGVRLEDH
jgi:hypothetical protein